MDLFIFARFHARAGQEAAVAATLCKQIVLVRGEDGCLAITAYRALRDAHLFYIQSRWTDDAAFERHAELLNTVAFVERMETLIDHPFEATRVRLLS
jgi:quinol monooxygenase YgiN